MLVIALFVVLISIVFIMFYKKQHPTYWKYDDSYILGNTIQNIESRYGRFDFTKKDSNNNGNKRKIIECSYLVAKKKGWFFWNYSC